MSRRLTAILSTAVAVLSLVLAVTPAPVQAAGNATISLTPVTSTQTLDSQFEVSLYSNSGDEPVNVIQAEVSYDPASLEYVGVNGKDSAFEKEIKTVASDGKITLLRYRTPGSDPVTGKQLITKLVFKALVDAGSTKVSSGPSSRVVRAGNAIDIWDKVTTSSTISFTLGSPTSSTTKTPSTDSSDANNLVAIRVVDANNKPVAGVPVALGGQRVKTDATGTSSFTNIKPGNQTVTTGSGFDSVKSSVTIASDQSGVVQEYQVRSRSNPLKYVIPVSLVLLAIAYVIGRKFLIRKRRLSAEANEYHESGAAGDVVVSQTIDPNNP